MYRIIGIFADETGKKHIKLIKKEALNTEYQWNSNYSIDVDWNNSDLYKGLNGSYFLTNTSYPYMQDISWTNKIATWNYTTANTKTSENSGPDYKNVTVENIYLHELNKSGKASNVGEWKPLSAKISLMYVSDYTLSLGNSALNYVIVDNSSTMKTGWMHLSNNDSDAPVSHEWTMSRLGKFTSYRAWIVSSTGNLNNFGIDNIFVVRPVFYLESNIEFSSNSGNGSINNPYMIL